MFEIVVTYTKCDAVDKFEVKTYEKAVEFAESIGDADGIKSIDVYSKKFVRRLKNSK